MQQARPKHACRGKMTRCPRSRGTHCLPTTQCRARAQAMDNDALPAICHAMPGQAPAETPTLERATFGQGAEILWRSGRSEAAGRAVALIYFCFTPISIADKASRSVRNMVAVPHLACCTTSLWHAPLHATEGCLLGYPPLHPPTPPRLHRCMHPGRAEPPKNNNAWRMAWESIPW